MKNCVENWIANTPPDLTSRVCAFRSLWPSQQCLGWSSIASACWAFGPWTRILKPRTAWGWRSPPLPSSSTCWWSWCWRRSMELLQCGSLNSVRCSQRIWLVHIVGVTRAVGVQTFSPCVSFFRASKDKGRIWREAHLQVFLSQIHERLCPYFLRGLLQRKVCVLCVLLSPGLSWRSSNLLISQLYPLLSQVCWAARRLRLRLWRLPHGGGNLTLPLPRSSWSSLEAE